MRPPLATAAAGLFFLACGNPEPPPCPQVPEILPPVGTGAVRTGLLVPEATEQSVTIPPARDYVEYTFKWGGASYTARYALSRDPPPVARRFIVVRRPRPLPDCASLVGRGPIIDAIEIRRGGSVISHGDKPYEALARCPGQGLTNKAPSELSGPRDGNGVPLGDEEFGWELSGKVTLESGDEVVVTVLDGDGDPFEVFAGFYETTPDVNLGVLSGSGTLRFP